MRAMISPLIAHLLSAAVAQRKGERLAEVFGRGGFQVGELGHALDEPGPGNKVAHEKSPAAWATAGL
jgi:hypothetical protein